jgi:hypothetical protein
MGSSFRNADRRTHRQIMLVGLLFCAAVAAITFFAGAQPDNAYIHVKADRLVSTVGTPFPGK